MPTLHETFARSAAKTLSYRVLVMTLDFAAVYLATRKTTLALGFTVASSLYTTAAYLLHERIWGRIGWGRRIDAVSPATSPHPG